MIRPVRMTLTNIFLLKEDVPAVTRLLAEMECFQIEEPSVMRDAAGMASTDTRAAATALSGLRTRLAQAVASLGVEGRARTDGLRVDPLGIAARVEEEFAPVEKGVARLREMLASGRQAQEKMDVLTWLVSALDEMGVGASTISGSRYVATETGTVPRTAFARLRESAEAAGHRVFGLGHVGARQLVLAVSSAERAGELRDGLAAARFERMEIKPEFIVDGRLSTQAAEMDMWRVREEVTEAGLEMARLASERGEEVLRWAEEVEVNLRLLDSVEKFGQSRYTSLIAGWTPTGEVADVRGRLGGLGRSMEVREVSEAETNGGPGHEVEPPTKLANPWFIRPFEFLVQLYGAPAYHGVDPTAFVAATFVFFFGAMFGDVGHGLTLAAAGGVLWRVFRRGGTLRDIGIILVWCGVMSTVFGFLYGSIFGDEEVLPALWLRPMEETGPFLMAGVILGALVINLGLFINFFQNLFARRYKEALFGEWAGSTILFYWGATYLFYLAFSGRPGEITWLLVGLVLGPPLLLTTFGATAWDWLAGRAEGEEESGGTLARPIELMLGSLTNTISFVRVPAFAMNHAALMGTVFLLAGMFRGGGGTSGNVVSWADIVVGNLLVIALEGLVVFVQAMRLQYYEFFGKFFHHQGRRFEPLTLRDGRSLQ